jgi:ketosteroid isomerase-like protein
LKQLAFESVERRVIEWLEAFNRHDANTLSRLYDDGAELVDPWYSKPLKGREAVRQDAENLFVAFPDLSCEIFGQTGSGDTIALEVRLSGTQDGPLTTPTGRVPPSNRHMTLTGASFRRFGEHGLVLGEHRYLFTKYG